MNPLRPALATAFLSVVLIALGCARQEHAPAPIPMHTAQGEVERVDRMAFLSGASAAVVQGEDLYKRNQPSDDVWAQASRLLELAHGSAMKNGETTEGTWEHKASTALGLIQKGIAEKKPEQVTLGLEQIKLYIDQAQQASAIEF